MASTLKAVLKSADTAIYEFDGYSVSVSDETIENGTYHLSVCKEALPPHHSEDHATLEEVESSLDGSLGYAKGASVWEAVEDEQ